MKHKDIFEWSCVAFVIFMIGYTGYMFGWMRGYNQSSFDKNKWDCELKQVDELPAYCLKYLK